MLSAHASFVKGVAWDPIGSFLASQSDDKSVIVWRTGSWTQEMRDDQHFAKTVMGRRGVWLEGEGGREEESGDGNMFGVGGLLGSVHCLTWSWL